MTAQPIPDRNTPVQNKQIVQGGPVMPTPRQVQVLELIADNRRRPEIAAKLGITRGTVSAYAQQAADRLGVDTTAAAIAVACAYNVIPMAGDRIAVPMHVIDLCWDALHLVSHDNTDGRAAPAVRAAVCALHEYAPIHT